MEESRGHALEDKAFSDPSTVKRILYNALEHFSRYGYSGASVREITQASQVTKPTLYYYFKNKEELYSKLAQTCFEDILETLTPVARKEGPVKERMLSLIRGYMQLCQDRRSVTRFVHLISIVPDRAAPDVGVKNFSQKLGGLLRLIVVEGVGKGEIKEVNTDAATYALFAIFYLHNTNVLSVEPFAYDFSLVEQAVERVLINC
jgi:AcrR family transcriptional regulator